MSVCGNSCSGRGRRYVPCARVEMAEEEDVRDLRANAATEGLRVRKRGDSYDLLDAKSGDVRHEQLTLEQAVGAVTNLWEDRATHSEHLPGVTSADIDRWTRDALLSVINQNSRYEKMSDKMRDKLARVIAILNE